MIRALVVKSGKAFRRIRVSGHAGYDEEGKDIFCAAVSMLVINTINCIEEYCGDRMEVREDSGFLEVTFPDSLSPEGTLLLNVMIKGLTDLEKEDGGHYLEVVFEEE